jgi:CubicO group peptidase (beta-lactamase class C family)
MLIGIAVEERTIRSIDDLASAYVAELGGTEYGRTSLRHLLQMSSGVRFSEDYQQPIDLRALKEMWAVWWAFVKRFGG